MREQKILIVDDNPEDRALYRRFLSKAAAFTFAECDTGEEGLRQYFALAPDCVLLDYRLPDLDGMEFLAKVRSPAGDIHAIVVLTSKGSEVVAVNALKMGAQDYLSKDALSSENLQRAVENAIEKVTLSRELEARTRALAAANEELQRIKQNLEAEVEKRTADLRIANANEQHLRKEAEEANRMKDEFLALLSHELRTPLTAIMGWSAAIQSGGLDPAVNQRAFESIRKNARAQSRLIDDLLDISGMVTGKFSLSMERLDLNTVIADVIEVARTQAEAKRVSLTSETSSFPVYIDGDGARLQQAILNVVANAIKFTPEDGIVALHLRVENEHISIAVTDTGIGIAPEFLPYVFDRFRQADASATRHYGGLGLGLAIVHHIMNSHHGSARAESRGTGQGSTITLELPLATQPLAAGSGKAS